MISGFEQVYLHIDNDKGGIRAHPIKLPFLVEVSHLLLMLRYPSAYRGDMFLVIGKLTEKKL
jgi:hypothetical protein